ncbi:MAG TPA: hypothetical protein VKM94_18750 [Blastocatellia bacterium]|nr:hypothetical protein [Blastocatellia bacterium]
MESGASKTGLSTVQLILVPALISICVTILRVYGELHHWSPAWFDTGQRGTVPSGTTWVIGITWLAAPFGVYFAFKLLRAGLGPKTYARAVGLSMLGVVVWLAASEIIRRWQPLSFPPILLLIWLAIVLGTLVAAPAWPSLFKVLLAYGFASRIPSTIVYFLAMKGSWRTHYDYVGIDVADAMSFWPKFLWLAFFPQLIFWVSFTVLVGLLLGSLSAFLLSLRKAERVPAQS